MRVEAGQARHAPRETASEAREACQVLEEADAEAKSIRRNDERSGEHKRRCDASVSPEERRERLEVRPLFLDRSVHRMSMSDVTPAAQGEHVSFMQRGDHSGSNPGVVSLDGLKLQLLEPRLTTQVSHLIVE